MDEEKLKVLEELEIKLIRAIKDRPKSVARAFLDEVVETRAALTRLIEQVKAEHRTEALQDLAHDDPPPGVGV